MVTFLESNFYLKKKKICRFSDVLKLKYWVGFNDFLHSKRRLKIFLPMFIYVFVGCISVLP